MITYEEIEEIAKRKMKKLKYKLPEADKEKYLQILIDEIIVSIAFERTIINGLLYPKK